MFLEKIKLHNYRQYKEDNEIDFGISEEKNINILVGSNGAGKTNLSNAIKWCFYGSEDLKQDMDFGILNMEVFEELKEGDTETVEVEVKLKTEDGERYSLKREKRIRKKNNKQEVVSYPDNPDRDGSRFKAYFHTTEKHKSATLNVDTPHSLINTLAPEKIKNYFFFDGEELENYFEATGSQKIKEAIFNISQLDLLDTIEERLSRIIDEYRSESRGLNPESEEIVKEIENLNKNFDEKNKELEKVKNTINELKQEKKNYLAEYKKLGGKSIKEILESIERLEIKKEKLEEELEDKKQDKNNALVSNSYLFFGYDSLITSLELFQKARDEKKIPPNISKSFIKELLEEGKCICGTDISDSGDKKHKKEIKKLLNEISDLGDNAGELVQKERDIINIKNNNLSSIHEKTILLNERIKELEDSFYETEKNIEELKAKAGSASLDKVGNFEERINDLNEEIEKEVGKRSRLEAELEDIQKNIEEENKELKRQNKKEEKGKHLNKCIDFAEESKAAASNIKEKIMDEIRKEISDETERYYQELHWKKDEKIDIRIDSDYQISAFQDGYNKFGAFSAGEQALLAMSFIFALNNVSGFKVPIILDTALGRISPEPKANYAKNISKYLKGTQVLLLFTGSEYSDEVKDKLKEAVFIENEISLKSPMSVKIK